MARFQFKLRTFIGRIGTHPAVSQRTLRALNLIADADLPRGPGWFDSSWDLSRGLEVSEGLPTDARLDEWLAVCLRGGGAAGKGSVPAQRHKQPGARLVPAAPHGALVHAMQFGDLAFTVAAEVTHLDQFSEFGIDGLELV